MHPLPFTRHEGPPRGVRTSARQRAGAGAGGRGGARMVHSHWHLAPSARVVAGEGEVEVEQARGSAPARRVLAWHAPRSR